MKLSGLATTVAVGCVLASCASADGSRAHRLLPTLRPGISSSGTTLLDDCKPFTDKKHPTYMFQIRLRGAFDVKHIDPEITEMKVTSPPWTSGNSDTSTPYTTVPAWTPKTRLDLDLDLYESATGKKREMVLIKIVVDDPSVKFRTDGFAITAETGNGQHMFCQFKDGFAEHDATFAAYYYFNPNPQHDTLGVFDIGLVIPDADSAYILPIFIDPEVKNNGRSQ
jgi:hypothetical protein